MIEPPTWSPEQLDNDLRNSIALFRNERMQEPLEDHLEAFDEYQRSTADLLETTVDLTQLDSHALDVLTDPHLFKVFRYLAGPPISEDDLQVLAEAPSLAKRRLQAGPDDVRRLIEVVRVVLDRRRFARVVEKREPTGPERSAAIMASAALMAASRAQTNRRRLGKTQQEALVADALKTHGFTEVSGRNIPNVSHAPNPGEFCGECQLGSRKADLVIRLLGWPSHAD